jgi:hypothetical protein
VLIPGMLVVHLTNLPVPAVLYSFIFSATGNNFCFITLSGG